MPKEEPYDFRNPEDLSFVLDKLTELFSVETHRESGERAETISRALANEQPDLYKQIYEVMSHNFRGGSEWEKISRGVSNVWAVLSRNIYFSSIQTESGWIVHGTFPFITSDAFHKYKILFGPESRMRNASPRTQIEIIAILFAIIIRNNFDSKPLLLQEDLSGSFYAYLIVGISRVDQYMMRSTIPERFTKDLNIISKKQEEISTNTTGIEERLVRAAKAIKEMTSTLLATRQQIEEQSGAVDDIKKEAIAHRAALREELKLSEAKKLWEDREKQSTWAFWISSTVILLIVSAIGMSLISYSDQVIGFVRNIEEKSFPAVVPSGDSVALTIALSVAFLSRIALIVFPAALVIWVLRIMVRFQTRSMLLMDDARQRVSILNTYLFLIERGVVSKSDRAAVLEALFRRAPGHGPEAVEPPDFVDLIKLNGGKGE